MFFVDMPASYNRTLVGTGEDTGLTVEDRIMLVRRSIADIKDSLAKWVEIERTPDSTLAQRIEAKQRVAYRERDFGGQWNNVEKILESFEAINDGQ